MNYTIEIKNNYLIINNISKDELDLDKTLNCGQAFRWYKENNNWIGVVNNQIWILKQYENYITTNLSKENKDQLIYYFNLDMNYDIEINKLDLDFFAKKSYKFSKGIHILRQDLIETMVTFLMSTCNTMTNIRNIIDKLCRNYGEMIKIKWEGKSYINYTFPSLEKLSQISEVEFKSLKMGFRAAYLVSMCKKLSGNTQLIVKLAQADYDDSIKLLCEFDGIGEKVANCISLFALHHIEAFPIDTHINKIIQREYNGNFNANKYGKYAGIIQQYMFYSEAFSKN